MDITTLLGLLLGFGALIASVVIEGGDLAVLINIPGAVIVFGGTLGVTLASFPRQMVMSLPRLIVLAFKGQDHKPEALVDFFIELAVQARREGLLSLEERSQGIEDPFLKKGIMLVVDGVDPKMVKEILHVDKIAMAQRHRGGYSMLEAMGGYAPTMGIIGTVMGLVHVLSSLDDPSGLGAAIAVAFIATLYGVGSANLIWLPIASKLKKRSEAELLIREMMMEGILDIQAGHNQYIVSEHVRSFLAPKLREGPKAGEVPAGQMQVEPEVA